jgi:uncharacterized protein (DUF1786 family)
VRILAIDVGVGTKDILIYDCSLRAENCVKLVLPSPSRVFANEIKRATSRGHDLFIDGFTIGGGYLKQALKEHIAVGRNTWMTEQAAFSLRNSLDDVAAMGITIISEAPPGVQTVHLHLSELDLPSLDKFLQTAGISLNTIDAIAVAVQDHGQYSRGQKHRQSRMDSMKAVLERNRDLFSLAFTPDEIPQGNLRMQSVALECAQGLPGAPCYIMDTAPAALAGCLADPVVKSAAQERPALLINVGNGHTMAAILTGTEITALFEHHTIMLSDSKLHSYLKQFVQGVLTQEAVLNDGGHGVFYLEQSPGLDALSVVAVTGPNRWRMGSRLGKRRVLTAMPAGDVMMSGPVGLVAAVKRRLAE